VAATVTDAPTNDRASMPLVPPGRSQPRPPDPRTSSCRASPSVDGSIDVAGNRGPGDLIAATVLVRVQALGSSGETLIYKGDIEGCGRDIPLDQLVPDLRDARSQWIVDPVGAMNDLIRDNNTLTVSLALPPTPTSTRGLSPGRQTSEPLNQ
jgi:hypothetical protein